MKIQGSEKLHHPAPLVFSTLRDKMDALVKLIPNIEQVEVLERRDEPPRVHLHNRWQGSGSDIPGALRPFIKKELTGWNDRAVWDESTLTCTWEIESIIGRNVFSCHGATQIVPNGENESTFTIDGELNVNPDKVPGVPGFLARKLQGPLENFIATLIRPNLTSTATAVE